MKGAERGAARRELGLHPGWWTPAGHHFLCLRPIQLTRLLGGLLTTLLTRLFARLLARLLAMEHAESETRETAVGQGTGHAEAFFFGG